MALAAKRAELGMTQQEVADRMGVDQPVYQRWEKDRVEPKPDSYDVIFIFLAVDEVQAAELLLKTRLFRAGLDSALGAEWTRRAKRASQRRGRSPAPDA